MGRITGNTEYPARKRENMKIPVRKNEAVRSEYKSWRRNSALKLLKALLFKLIKKRIIWPNILNTVLEYPDGYRVSGFQISRISGSYHIIFAK